MMWSDGLFHTNVWEQYGFNDYELKHCCFGSDGDSNDSGSDPGQGDFEGTDADVNEKDSGLATEGDLQSFEDALGSEEYGRTEMREDMASIAGAAPSMSPYIGGSNSLFGDGKVPGLIDREDYVTKEDISFEEPNQKLDNRGNLFAKAGENLLGFTPAFDNRTSGTYEGSREELGKSYLDAYDKSTDFTSALASLFGVKSPIAYDEEKGYFEDTEFDPFDAPLIGATLSLLSPPLGALYGLTKGVVKGDPIGGALSMIGPYSRFAPAVNLGRKAITAYETLTDRNVNLSNMFGVGSPPQDTSYFSSGQTVLDPNVDLQSYLGLDTFKDKVGDVVSSVTPDISSLFDTNKLDNNAYIFERDKAYGEGHDAFLNAINNPEVRR